MSSVCILFSLAKLTGAFNRTCHPSPLPGHGQHRKEPGMGDITRGLLLSPGAVHPQVRTCYQIHHQQYSQLSVFPQDKYTVLSMGVFFFSLSFGLCNFKGFYHKVHGERMKKKPTPLHVLGLTRAVKCLDRSGSLNAQLALYFRSSVDFNFWLSPLATENKRLPSHLLAKSKMTLSLAERQHEYPISFIKC